MRKILCILALFAAVASSALAGGYQVNLQGQRQTAMGNTGVGLSYDASSIFFNPGALSFLERNSLVLGASMVNAQVKYLGVAPSIYTAETENIPGMPFFLYGSYNITDKLTAGIGVYTPYGSSVAWEDDWSGRFALEQISLRAIFVQPTLSYQITDQLGIGAGFQYVFGSVNLQRAIPITDQNGNDGHVELKGGASGIGFNVGTFYKPSDKLSFGLSYRSTVNMAVDGGDAIFNVASGAASLFPTTTFDSELPLPGVANIGVGVLPTDKLTLSFEVSMTFWSAYEELKFEYAEPIAGENETVADRNYEDAFTVKLGAEYMLNDNFAVRGGFYYDQTPVKDGYMTPETPDSDAIGLTVGAGYKVGENFQIDLSCLFLNRAERTNIAADGSDGIDGTFKASAIVPGFALGYSF